MSIVVCPKCSSKNRTPEGYAGRRVQCAVCGHSFLLPQTAEAASEAILLEPVSASQDADEDYDFAEWAAPESEGASEPVFDLPAIPRRVSQQANDRRTGSRAERKVPSSAAKYAAIGAACFIVGAASVAGIFFAIRRSPPQGPATEGVAASIPPMEQTAVPGPATIPPRREEQLKGKPAGQPAANEREARATTSDAKHDRSAKQAETVQREPVADEISRGLRAHGRGITPNLMAMPHDQQLAVVGVMEKIELQQHLTQAEVDLLQQAGYAQGELGQKARALASREDAQPVQEAKTIQPKPADPTPAPPATTDSSAENERLFLDMLMQERDAWARQLRRKIGECETALANRKHRSAKSSHSDAVQVPLGKGKVIGQTPDVSRKEIERAITDLKQQLELVENGSTIPADRWWDPRIFPKFGRLGGRIRIIQVLGPSDMLIDIEGAGAGILWIQGFSTQGHVDDQKIVFPEGLLFVSAGTKSYSNALGAPTTARLMRPLVIDRPKVIAEYRAQSRGEASPVSRATAAPAQAATGVSAPAVSSATVSSAAIPSAAVPTVTAGSFVKLTDDEQRYLAALMRMRGLRVDDIRRELAELDPERASRKKTRKRPTKSAKSVPTDRFRRLQDEMADLESGKTIIEPQISQEGLSNVGSVMRIRTSLLKVVQMIGPEDLLITPRAGTYLGQIWWLHGFPQKGRADGEVFSMDELVIVGGTKSYDTVNGTSRTVFVWRPLVIDREKVLAEYRAQSKPAEPEKPVAAKRAPRSKAATPSASAEPADADSVQKHCAALLKNARTLLKAGLRDGAKKDLLRIIHEAPGTAVAKDAQQELDQLAGP
jgi:hypothetical protein